MPSRSLCRLYAVFAVVRRGCLWLISIAATNAALLGEVVTRSLSVWESARLFVPLCKSGKVATGLLMVLAPFPGGGICLFIAATVTGCESSKH